jgi:hypothetical protein
VSGSLSVSKDIDDSMPGSFYISVLSSFSIERYMLVHLVDVSS